MGYPGHLWVHGINYQKRETENSLILAGDFTQINNLETPISYIVLSRSDLTFKIPSDIQAAYQNQKYRVVRINQ